MTLYCKNMPYTLETDKNGGFPKTVPTFRLPPAQLALGDWHTRFATEAAEAPTADIIKLAELV